jgi:hypothetical protein
MAHNRLFVDELVSVGMVKAGDNPESEVVIYKSHNSNSHGESQLESPPIDKNAESVPQTEKVNMDLSAIEDQDLRKAVESPKRTTWLKTPNRRYRSSSPNCKNPKRICRSS